MIKINATVHEVGAVVQKFIGRNLLEIVNAARTVSGGEFYKSSTTADVRAEFNKLRAVWSSKKFRTLLREESAEYCHDFNITR